MSQVGLYDCGLAAGQAAFLRSGLVSDHVVISVLDSNAGSSSGQLGNYSRPRIPTLVISTLLPVRLSIGLRDPPSSLRFLQTLRAEIESRASRKGHVYNLSLHRRLLLVSYFDDGFNRTVAAVGLDFEGLSSPIKRKTVRYEGP
jgi:hypothetical protein